MWEQANARVLELQFIHNAYIEGTNRVQAEYGKSMRVIATGGLAPLFARHCSIVEHVDPDLTMIGLVEIYFQNRDFIRSGKKAQP